MKKKIGKTVLIIGLVLIIGSGIYIFIKTNNINISLKSKDEIRIENYLKDHYPNDKFIITKSEKKQQLKELSCTNCLMNVKIWTIHSDVTNVTFTVTDEYNDDNELIDTTDSYSSKVFSVIKDYFSVNQATIDRKNNIIYADTSTFQGADNLAKKIYEYFEKYKIKDNKLNIRFVITTNYQNKKILDNNKTKSVDEILKQIKK